MIKDSHGWIPYTAALISGRDSISQILLEYGYEAVDFVSFVILNVMSLVIG